MKTRAAPKNGFKILQKTLYLIFGMCLFLSLHCGKIEVFEGRISLDTLNPDKRPCRKNYECNNLIYIGSCVNRICRSIKRSICKQKGDTTKCSIATKEGLCALGVQRCQPDPFQQQVWDDCLLSDASVRERCIQGCQEGQVRECYTAQTGCKLGKDGKFKCFLPCGAGVQRCVKGKWGKCIGETTPKKEECNGIDDDCDGKIDADSDGVVLMKPCYSGPLNTRNVGICHFGIYVCDKNSWGNCQQEQTPKKESCNGVDDNCNGQIDDCPRGSYCMSNGQCSPPDEQGTSQEYTSPSDAGGTPDAITGPPDNLTRPDAPGQEPIAPDTATGQPDQTTGQDSYMPDAGPQPDITVDVGAEPPPDSVPESSAEPVPEPAPDNTKPDQNFECTPFATQPCYSGPPGTRSVGECKAGTRRCNSRGKWERCQNEILPKAEVCDRKDNDCNGRTDENPNGKGLLTQKCYTGPSSTRKRGTCRDGVRLCLNGRLGSCLGESKPKDEICNDLDDDCDGQIDELKKCE